MYIDDQPLQTAAEIRTVAQRLDQRLAPQDRLGLVVVDHLYRVEVEDLSQPASYQLADIVYELQGLARQLNVAVLCLMQVNCAPYVASENRATRLAFPGVHREADVVLLLHRPKCRSAADGANEEGSESKALLSVIRRRDRLAEKVELSWNGRYGRFSDHAAL